MASVRSPAATAADAEVALGDVLQAVVRELERIVALGEGAQAALSPLLAGSQGAALQAQDLDALVQQAAGLGVFVAALERSCRAAWVVSPDLAARGLPLDAQRRRLAFTHEAETPLPEAGALDLF